MFLGKKKKKLANLKTVGDLVIFWKLNVVEAINSVQTFLPLDLETPSNLEMLVLAVSGKYDMLLFCSVRLLSAFASRCQNAFVGYLIPKEGNFLLFSKGSK